MRFPDKLDVLQVHARLISETGGRDGIRDEGLLESGLAAAENLHHYEAADVVRCAVAYAFHLTQTHPFIDGNKRAGCDLQKQACDFVIRHDQLKAVCL